MVHTIFLAMAVMNISASALHLLFGDSSLPDLFYSDGFFLRASRGIFSFDKLYQDKSPLFSQNTVELRDNGIYHETDTFQSLHFYKHIGAVLDNQGLLR